MSIIRANLTITLALSIMLGNIQIATSENSQLPSDDIQSTLRTCNIEDWHKDWHTQLIQQKQQELQNLQEKVAVYVQISRPPWQLALFMATGGGCYGWYEGMPQDNARTCSSFGLGSLFGVGCLYGYWGIKRGLSACRYGCLTQRIAELQEEIAELQEFVDPINKEKTA